MHELGEIGIFCSKFPQEKFANIADAIENLVRNVYVHTYTFYTQNYFCM